MSSEKDQKISKGTREEIMRGVYKALCEYGYAAVTMQKIADETNKCKSSLHYHYDTKNKLLLEFIDYLLTNFKERTVLEVEEPIEKLRTFLDKMIFGGSKDLEEHLRFHKALLELRTESPYNESFKEQVSKNEKYIRGVLAGIIEEGIKNGSFREVNPEKTATLLLSALDGAMIRQITTNENLVLERVREAMDDLIKEMLLKN